MSDPHPIDSAYPTPDPDKLDTDKLDTDTVTPAGLIVRERQPDNLEFPFHTLASVVTPTEQFFVRSRFAVPSLTPQTWRLRVEGAVANPLTLSLNDLQQMAAHTLPATLECAGNSRAFLVPKTPGVAWASGAVSNAEWTGVPLADILAQAGVSADAVEVILEGADCGKVKEAPKPPGEVYFARSLPLTKAQQPSVLLAYAMNGAPLTPAHGFPLRAVVPGWYGMASIKWLTRIIVTRQPFHGYFQTVDYSYWVQEAGRPPHMAPITTMQVKAAIARPMPHEVVAANRAYRIHGAAWAGDAPVAGVMVSTDGGVTWQAACLLGEPMRHTWCLWEYSWQTPADAGTYTLMARATDAYGCTQPLTHDAGRGRYMVSHVLPVEAQVR
ncbi:MAG: sulfite oxidase [Chloroflexota bacterium]|nr:sulfite oxidase [Chloroflexota bacterium]